MLCYKCTYAESTDLPRISFSSIGRQNLFQIQSPVGMSPWLVCRTGGARGHKAFVTVFGIKAPSSLLS